MKTLYLAIFQQDSKVLIYFERTKSNTRLIGASNRDKRFSNLKLAMHCSLSSWQDVPAQNGALV